MPCGVAVSSEVEAGIARADCLIDFTRPQGAASIWRSAVSTRSPWSSAPPASTTRAKAAIADAAREIPIVFSPNMSVGFNVVIKLLDAASRILNEGYDIEIVEAHHRHKVDAPSRTTLPYGRGDCRCARPRSQAMRGLWPRGLHRQARSVFIGFATVRGGDIVGDHTVMYCGTGERVEISHKAGSRVPYALGSLRAVRFLAGRSSGLFDMQDVLRFRAEFFEPR